MKDVERESLERSRPRGPALQAINHCLSCLYKDDKHGVSDKVVENLSFEELIGTLLVARDLAESPARNLGSYD